MERKHRSRQERMTKKIIQGVFAAFLLLFLSAGNGSAAENSECLECHKNPRLSKGKKDGTLLSLHVNEERFKASVHGAAGMGCVDCHQEAKPNVHPAEGFPEIGCASCHQDSAEAFKKTTHGMVLESGSELAPKCQNCHTSHYIRKVSDPESPVSPTHLAAACSQCHPEAKPPKGFLAALATYRITGHPKVNLGFRYDTKTCANCHPENTGHPEKPGENLPFCVRCHDRSVETPLLLGPVHFKMSLQEQPVPFLLRILYGLGLAVVVIVCIAFFAYRAYRCRKEKKSGTDKPPEGGEKEKTNS